jgi:hypothetical protein
VHTVILSEMLTLEDTMRTQVIARFFDETEGAFRYREVNDAGSFLHGDRDRATRGDVYLRKLAISGERR